MWLSKGILSVAAGISLVSWSKGPGFVFRWGEPLDGVGKLKPGGSFWEKGKKRVSLVV